MHSLELTVSTIYSQEIIILRDDENKPYVLHTRVYWTLLSPFGKARGTSHLFYQNLKSVSKVYMLSIVGLNCNLLFPNEKPLSYKHLLPTCSKIFLIFYADV